MVKGTVWEDFLEVASEVEKACMKCCAGRGQEGVLLRQGKQEPDGKEASPM